MFSPCRVVLILVASVQACARPLQFRTTFRASC